MVKWLQDVDLTGETITLKPLTQLHRNSLIEAASDGELWKLWYTNVPSEETIFKYIKTALKQKEKCIALPFIVQENASEKVTGINSFL